MTTRRFRQGVDVVLPARADTERLATLLEATLRLSESLDYQRTLENVVRFVADRFASYSLLDMVAEDGRIERVAVAHSDAARQSLVERIRAFRPLAHMIETHPVARAIARREATLETIDDAWIERSAVSPAHAATMRELNMRALLVVPVMSGDRILGALTCALDARAPQSNFDAHDIAFAEELGRRSGMAIEHARLFEHERRIAIALQAASLPRTLPQSSLRLDAYYRPGRSEATIGGDWYDAFALEDGRTVLTVGDVGGKGLEAAVTMGRLRQSMQAAAMLSPDPEAMLEVADRTLRLQESEAFATAVAAIYDPTAGTFTVASAGHPAPLLRHPNGTVEPCEVRGTMLGLTPSSTRRATYFRAEPGSTFLLYTDGLVESTRDIDAGERMLRQTFAKGDVLVDDRPAHALVDAVLGAAVPSDDIAVLIASTSA